MTLSFVEQERRDQRFLDAVSSTFQIAGMIAGVIGSSKAQKAQAAQLGAIFTLLFSISKQLDEINAGIQEILQVLNDLPDQLKDEIEQFEAEKFHAQLLGNYQIFLEKKENFVRQPGLWDKESEVNNRIEQYKETLSDIQKVSRTLMAFPLNSTPLKEATICLAFQTEMDVHTELKILGADTAISEAAATYKRMFEASIDPNSRINARIKKLVSELKSFGNDVTWDETHIGFLYFKRQITEFFETNTEIVTYEDVEENITHWYHTSKVYKVALSPIDYNAAVLGVEYDNREVKCHETLIEILELGKVVGYKSSEDPKGCRKRKLPIYTEVEGKKFRSYISGYNAIVFEIQSWINVLDAMKLCLDQANKIETAVALDPRVVGKAMGDKSGSRDS